MKFSFSQVESSSKSDEKEERKKNLRVRRESFWRFFENKMISQQIFLLSNLLPENQYSSFLFPPFIILSLHFLSLVGLLLRLSACLIRSGSQTIEIGDQRRQRMMIIKTSFSLFSDSSLTTLFFRFLHTKELRKDII